MARPERQLRQKAGAAPMSEGEWRFDPAQQRETGSFAAFAGGVPNNPDNLRSFQQADRGGIYQRRNPYGDAVQDVAPEEPVVTKANQWAGRDAKSLPNMDPKVFDEESGLPFGFGSQSPLSQGGGSFAAPAPLGGSTGRPAGKRAQKGLDFGTGKRNAPKP